jgi:hypothetical protein
VRFIIGPEDHETIFTVHEEVAYVVDTFAAAFKSNFIEGKTRIYHLRDTTSEAFRLLIQYLYSEGTYSYYQTRESWDEWAKNNKTKAASWAAKENENFVRLWILADKLCMSELCKKVLTDLKNAIRWTKKYPLDLARLVCQLTNEGNPLRELFFELSKLLMTPGDLEIFTETFPQEVQQELLACLVKYNHKTNVESQQSEATTDNDSTPDIGNNGGNESQ